jgi:hypothetical protein
LLKSSGKIQAKTPQEVKTTPSRELHTKHSLEKTQRYVTPFTFLLLPPRRGGVE